MYWLSLNVTGNQTLTLHQDRDPTNNNNNQISIQLLYLINKINSLSVPNLNSSSLPLPLSLSLMYRIIRTKVKCSVTNVRINWQSFHNSTIEKRNERVKKSDIKPSPPIAYISYIARSGVSLQSLRLITCSDIAELKNCCIIWPNDVTLSFLALREWERECERGRGRGKERDINDVRQQADERVKKKKNHYVHYKHSPKVPQAHTHVHTIDMYM